LNPIKIPSKSNQIYSFGDGMVKSPIPFAHFGAGNHIEDIRAERCAEIGASGKGAWLKLPKAGGIFVPASTLW
jgi:hypothetical protein